MNFTDYLIYAKSQLGNLDQFHVINIVLGNESCDLDSTISACVYAYFLHNVYEILYLPIMNTDLSKFCLRNEIHQKIDAQLQKFLQSSIDNSKLYSDLKEKSCDAIGYSVQDLLQKDAKQVIGPNLRLIMSSLPMNYTVEKLIKEIKTINEYLQSNELNLDLHECSIPINQAQIKLFNQKNFRSSRKQILPFIEKFVLNFSK